jgi:hypothetical protein
MTDVDQSCVVCDNGEWGVLAGLRGEDLGEVQALTGPV